MEDYVLLLFIFSVWIAVNLGALVSFTLFSDDGRCSKFYRYEYMVPAKKLGCWLGKEK